MEKYLIVFLRTTPVHVGEVSYLRKTTGRRTARASSLFAAALATARLERKKRPGAQIKFMSVWKATASGWQLVGRTLEKEKRWMQLK